MQYALCYVSTAAQSLSTSEIENLLESSSNKNNFENITGILLFSNGNFFQVIEGDKAPVQALFEKIQQDKRHYDLITIFKREIESQKFDTYENAFVSLDAAFNRNDLDLYTSHVEKLDPSIQNSVKYILNSFS